MEQQVFSLLKGKRLVALTGAGISTDSGIPDYRGPETKRRARNPIQYREFMNSPEARTRYWARSALGWPKFSSFQPNAAHYALAQLEQANVLQGIITQNVDRLHQAAGSLHVIELHGALSEVKCLNCDKMEDRHSLQQRMTSLNPNWSEQPVEYAPDGDAEVAPERTRQFLVPHCLHCKGVLKPNVVFFGENVAKPIVEEAWSLLEQAEALLVLGSSLTVFSGYRFVRGAEQRNIPVVIVNLGETRGDPHATLKLDTQIGEFLPQLTQALLSPIQSGERE